MAVLIPVIFFIIAFSLPDSNSESTNKSSGGGADLTITATIDLGGPETSNTGPITPKMTMTIGAIIFVIGLLVYFLKSAKIKTILSYVYLVSAIADIILLTACFSPFLVAVSCGLLLVVFIPGILQIVAGVKFVKGAKEYAG